MRTLNAWVNVLRNGVKHTILNPIGAPTIEMDGNASIKSSMSGVFSFNDAVDFAADELQPIVEINGEEHPIGVFLPATITVEKNNGEKTVNIEAYDRCWKCEATIAENTYHINAGVNYISAIEELLALCGVENILAVPTENVMATAREDWETGTPFLKIINQLLDEINYKQLWFDKNGYAVLEPEVIVDASNIARTYDYHNVESMIIDKIAAKTDYFNAPNRILVVCSNADNNTVMKAVAENKNEFSPLSINRRGRVIMAVEQVDNIASQRELEIYAELLIQDTMLRGDTISLQTAIRTDCGMNDVVAISHDDVSGICVETGWSIELCTGGTMTHNISRAVTFV